MIMQTWQKVKSSANSMKLMYSNGHLNHNGVLDKSSARPLTAHPSFFFTRPPFVPAAHTTGAASFGVLRHRVDVGFHRHPFGLRSVAA